jgi:hypothetical protein
MARNPLSVTCTQALSGASRATIDACRTVFVWLVALWAGWETFHNLQVVGFIVLVSGARRSKLRDRTRSGGRSFVSSCRRCVRP